MLVQISHNSWYSVTMTEVQAPTIFPRVASWKEILDDGEWHYSCKNLDAELDVSSLGTGKHLVTGTCSCVVESRPPQLLLTNVSSVGVQASNSTLVLSSTVTLASPVDFGSMTSASAALRSPRCTLHVKSMWACGHRRWSGSSPVTPVDCLRFLQQRVS